MSNREVELFVTAEKNAMELSVYIESEKARKNLRLNDNGEKTDDFFLNWIDDHAHGFRNAWEDSKCKNCRNIETCCFCLKSECQNFISGNA